MTTEMVTDFLWIALFVGAGLGVMLFVIYSLSQIAKNEKKIRHLKRTCNPHIGEFVIDLSEDSIDGSIKLTINMDYAELVDVVSKQHEVTFSAWVKE